MYIETTVGKLLKIFKPWAIQETVVIKTTDEGIYGSNTSPANIMFTRCVAKKDFTTYKCVAGEYNIQVEKIVGYLKNHSLNDKIEFTIDGNMCMMVVDDKTHYRCAIYTHNSIPDRFPSADYTASFTINSIDIAKSIKLLDGEESRVDFITVEDTLEIYQINDGREGISTVLNIEGNNKGAAAYNYANLLEIARILPNDVDVLVEFGMDLPLHIMYKDGGYVKVDFVLAPYISTDG